MKKKINDKAQQEHEKDVEQLDRFISKRVQASYYIASISFGVVLSSVFIGYVLDGFLGTRPWIMLVLMLGSFPLNMYILYKVLKQKFN